jgi:hypothetical protein
MVKYDCENTKKVLGGSDCGSRAVISSSINTAALPFYSVSLEIRYKKLLHETEKGARPSSNPFCFLVAGDGFEPPTFGL